MVLFGIFKKKKAPTAKQAKERLLKIVIEDSLNDTNRPEFLNEMRREILDVVNKYVQIDIADINTNITNKDNSEVLELNILFPDTVSLEKARRGRNVRLTNG